MSQVCGNRGFKHKFDFLPSHFSMASVNLSWNLECKYLKYRKIADRTRAMQLSSDGM